MGVLTTAALVLAPAGVASAAAPDCSVFNDPVYQVVNPATNASLVTTSASEAASAADDGFTENQGEVFLASKESGEDLVAVHLMYRLLSQDYMVTRYARELLSAVTNFGYADRGVSFYASASSSSCLEPVNRYRKGSKHRLATGPDATASLVDDGWTYEHVAFYAAPADSDAPAPPAPPAPAPPASGDAFSFAVIPDTQTEVTRSGDPRMINRTNWLAKQSNLAFVAHTGDMVNWDTPGHEQMALAAKSMDVLEEADIPYSIAIGNHDTPVTGVGGSARDPARSYLLLRETDTINSYFKASDFGAVAGAFESGKIDNVYSTFNAGGHQWMVLSLEFCPRASVVQWAKGVVASHPDHNVLISTHSYLNGGGGIDSYDQGYGVTSGQELFDQLVSQYPNVKMVFSGHVGSAQRARIDTGRNGNKIYSFLTTMHDNTTNPVRMFDVDPANGTVRTRLYAPYTNKTWTDYTETLTGVQLVD